MKFSPRCEPVTNSGRSVFLRQESKWVYNSIQDILSIGFVKSRCGICENHGVVITIVSEIKNLLSNINSITFPLKERTDSFPVYFVLIRVILIFFVFLRVYNPYLFRLSRCLFFPTLWISLVSSSLEWLHSFRKRALSKPF